MGLRFRLPGLLLALAWAAPAAQGPIHRDEAQIMLFTLNLENRQLAEVFPGYPGKKDGYLLPLGELCRALFLGIKVDARQGLAEGFIVEEKRRFRLDLKTGRLDIGGKALAYVPSGVEWHEDEIYVDARLLEEWLPIALKVDANAATIRVVPKEQLPVQGLWEREDRAGHPAPTEAGNGTKGFPYLPTPYAFLDPPFLDQTVNFVSSRVDGKRPLDASGTTFVTGDLLWMNATGFFNSTSGNLVDTPRLNLARRDPNAGLLGPLQAREVELGDLLNTGQPLLGSPILGRGVHVDNLPLNFQYSFERYAFRGNLLPGWSVELYQNEVLVGIQQSRGDGLYEFRNVPTYFGVNDFKLVFYGPEGQRRVELQRLDQRQARTPDGQFLYNVVATGPSADPQQGGRHLQYLAEAAYGLSRKWDLRAMVTQVGSTVVTAPLGETSAAPAVPAKPNRFAALAIQGFLSDVSLQLAGAANQDHGTMATFGVSTGLGYNSLTVRRSVLSNFDNPDFHAVGPIKAHTQVQLVLMPSPGKGFPGSLNLDETRDDLVQGGHVTTSSIRGALSLWNTSISNTVSWNRSDLPQTQTSLANTTTDTLLLSQRIFQGSVRGQADYDLDGGKVRLRTYSLVGEYYGAIGYTLSADMQRILVQRENQYHVAVNKFDGTVGLLAGLAWARSTGLTANLQVHISLGRDPGSGHVFAQARPLANTGAVSGRAFLDTNGNGRLDPDEPILGGAALRVGGSSRPGPLGEQAPLFQTDLYPSDTVALTLDTSGMDDPFIKAAQPGISILPRPGKVARVDFPMVVAGEVTGTAQMAGPKGARDLAGLALELLDGKGRRVIAARSSFDGFYDFRDLAPGRYQLRVLPEEGQRLGVSLPEPRFLEIKAKGSIHEGILMKVVPLPTEADSASAPAPVVQEEKAASVPQAPAVQAIHREEWTIQVGAFYDATNLAKEQRTLGAWAKDLMVVPFHDPHQGQGTRLITGRFASRAEAIQAIQRLPSQFRQAKDHPFPVVLKPEESPRRLP